MMAVVKLWLVCLVLVVAQLGFGAYGVIVSKFAKEKKADPLIFILIRTCGSFPVFLAAAFVLERSIQIPSLRELPIFMALGLTQMFGSPFLFILGIYYTNANIASILQPTIPVWTALLAIILRIEPFPDLRTLRGWAKFLGIPLAAAGAMIMMVQNVAGEPEDSVGTINKIPFWGFVFLLGNTLCTASYIVLVKKFIFGKEDSCWRAKPVTVVAWAALFGTIFMALASLYYVTKPEKFLHFPKEEIFPIFYAIFITSGLCYLLISWSNTQISASLVTATWPLQVLFCAILSYFVLGEALNTLEYLGSMFTIAGLVAVVWSNYAEENRAKSCDDIRRDEQDLTVA